MGKGRKGWKGPIMLLDIRDLLTGEKSKQQNYKVSLLTFLAAFSVNLEE